MQLAYQELVEEGLIGRLSALDALGPTIYSLYESPAPAPLPLFRIVILSERFNGGSKLEGEVCSLEFEEACAFIWQTLYSNGRRLGEVVCDCEPESTDYVLWMEGDSLRLVRPAHRPAPPPGRADISLAHA
jgi:hypothetical protein